MDRTAALWVAREKALGQAGASEEAPPKAPATFQKEIRFYSAVGQKEWSQCARVFAGRVRRLDGNITEDAFSSGGGAKRKGQQVPWGGTRMGAKEP